MASKIKAGVALVVLLALGGGGYFWHEREQREVRSVAEFYLFLRESNETFGTLRYAGCSAATEDDVRKNTGVELGDVVLKLRRENDQPRDFPVTSLMTSLQQTSGFQVLRDRFHRLGLDYNRIPKKDCSAWEKAFVPRDVATRP